MIVTKFQEQDLSVTHPITVQLTYREYANLVVALELVLKEAENKNGSKLYAGIFKKLLSDLFGE